MSINWNSLREPKTDAFEELCCQLALREPLDNRSKFVRKGSPDAGLECYWVRPDGTETGWQAKFFLTSPSDGQWSQIDSSVKVAIDKHPRLTHLIICLPQNLSDARRPKTETARQKWDKRVEKWNHWASEIGRTVEFKLRDESALIGSI